MKNKIDLPDYLMNNVITNLCLVNTEIYECILDVVWF